MIKITGYDPIQYRHFIGKLRECIEQSEKHMIKIATEINIKSTLTITNSLNEQQQVVSDKVLTGIMKSVGMDGFVLWFKGEKYFYVKK